MRGRELYAPRASRQRRTWTLAAIILAAIFMVGGQLLAAIPAVMLGFIDAQGREVGGWPALTYILAVAFGLTALLVFAWVRFFERRSLATIGFNARGPARFLRGYGIGLAYMASTVAVIALLGGYGVEGGGAFTQPAALIPILVLLLGFIIQGSTEEIVFRGWLMQLIASRHGLWIAILVNAVLFGLVHGGNIEPSRELAVGLINIVLFGTFIGLYAAREGSLWGVCGWHAAWNWLLGLGFGLEVSGQVVDATPLLVDLTTRETAPWWLTGAAFGPEASVVTTVILLISVLIMIRRGGFADYGVASQPAVVEAEAPAPVASA